MLLDIANWVYFHMYFLIFKVIDLILKRKMLLIANDYFLNRKSHRQYTNLCFCWSWFYRDFFQWPSTTTQQKLLRSGIQQLEKKCWTSLSMSSKKSVYFCLWLSMIDNFCLLFINGKKMVTVYYNNNTVM